MAAGGPGDAAACVNAGAWARVGPATSAGGTQQKKKSTNLDEIRAPTALAEDSS